MRIRKKTFILLITYLTSAVIALGAYTAVMSAQGANYRRTAEYGYSNAFDEVVLAVGNLDTALKKASYAKGQEMSVALCGDIYSSCLAAEMTMAALPFSSFELEKTASFIGVCGDYAASLLKSHAQTGLGDEERGKMAELSEISDGLARELQALQNDIIGGDVIMDAPESLFYKDDEEGLLSVRMRAYEAVFAELPELSYEGVYTKTEDAAAGDRVSEKAAMSAAKKLVDKKLEIEFEYEDGSRCFSFDGGTVIVSADGNVLSVSSSRSVAGDADDEELIAAAEKILLNAGFENMKLLQKNRSDSVLTAAFAPVTEDGTLISAATVRVSVAADDASLYAFNAREYYENFNTACDLTPTLTQKEAEAALPQGLTLKGCTLEVYATDGGSRLCYDFALVDEDGMALNILVDAASGKQIDIVI